MNKSRHARKRKYTAPAIFLQKPHVDKGPCVQNIAREITCILNFSWALQAKCWSANSGSEAFMSYDTSHLRILLIFGQKLDIDKWWLLTEPFFRKKIWNAYKKIDLCFFQHLEFLKEIFLTPDIFKTLRNGR